MLKASEGSEVNRIVHLTDVHLAERAEKPGIDPRENLRRILLEVEPYRKNSFMLITGDATSEGGEELYRELEGMLSGWRYAICPGNHDRREWISNSPGGVKVFEGAGFKLLCIDTSVDGQVGGEIGEGELEWVRGEMLRSDKPIILAMHHPPDHFKDRTVAGILLSEASTMRLEELIEGSARGVIAVLCGHLHQCMVASVAGALCIVAPSSAYAMRMDGGGLQYGGHLGEYMIHHISGGTMVSEVRQIREWVLTEESLGR